MSMSRRMPVAYRDASHGADDEREERGHEDRRAETEQQVVAAETLSGDRGGVGARAEVRRMPERK